MKHPRGRRRPSGSASSREFQEPPGGLKFLSCFFFAVWKRFHRHPQIPLGRRECRLSPPGQTPTKKTPLTTSGSSTSVFGKTGRSWHRNFGTTKKPSPEPNRNHISRSWNWMSATREQESFLPDEISSDEGIDHNPWKIFNPPPERVSPQDSPWSRFNPDPHQEEEETHRSPPPSRRERRAARRRDVRLSPPPLLLPRPSRRERRAERNREGHSQRRRLHSRTRDRRDSPPRIHRRGETPPRLNRRRSSPRLTRAPVEFPYITPRSGRGQ